MRKHCVRKWIHAILDMLPLVIIPIFAIYSHRHTIDSYSVTVSENKVIELNQNIINGKPNSLSNVSSDNTSFLRFEDDDYNRFQVGLLDDDTGYLIPNNTLDYSLNDKIFVKFTIYCEVSLDVWIDFNNYTYESDIITVGSDTVYTFNDIIFVNSDDFELFDSLLAIGFYQNNGDVYYVEVYNIQMFNLTAMYGTGNEPIVSVFNSQWHDDYYDYGVAYKQLLKDVGTITYHDTDIGSQFLYALYNPINKYFNFNNVGVFNGLYNWFELNMFNGNAPLSFFIVWNVILYEFIMDLIFLTYMVFMFVIDFTEHFIDSFFDKSYRGGR